MRKIAIIGAVIIMFGVGSAFAQDFCKGDFNYNGSVAAEDVSTFLEHFGRSQYNNPCPPDGPSPVPRTGQTTSYATGDDGDLQRGVALVTPRFTDNGDGTVTDNQTGLIWLKNANCFGMRTWNNALSDCNGLASNSCGLTDGSSAGDWRLPNYKELFSLVDAGNYNPALPSAHPFDNAQPNNYWSSTTLYGVTDAYWDVDLYWGNVYYHGWLSTYYLWCVRGGH